MTQYNKSQTMKLQGSIVALVTPMSATGQIDYVALRRLADWHVEQGRMVFAWSEPRVNLRL